MGGGASKEIVKCLVDSHKSFHPDHTFNSTKMLEMLCLSDAQWNVLDTFLDIQLELWLSSSKWYNTEHRQPRITAHISKTNVLSHDGAFLYCDSIPIQLFIDANCKRINTSIGVWGEIKYRRGHSFCNLRTTICRIESNKACLLGFVVEHLHQEYTAYDMYYVFCLIIYTSPPHALRLAC